MINNFDNFINEAARAKFPAYKEGDEALILGFHEMRVSWNNYPNIRWSTYDKYVCYENFGAVVKILKVDLEKKEYIVEGVTGVLTESPIRGRSGSKPKSPSKAILKVKQSMLSTEQLAEAKEFLDDRIFADNEEVSVELTGKSMSRKIVGIALGKTLETRKIHYLVKDVAGVVPEEKISKEVKVDENAIQLLAEEIAKVLDVKMEKDDSKFIYDVSNAEGNELIKGKIYFKSTSEREKFESEMEKFLEKWMNKDFQKIMNNGEVSTVSVKKHGNSSYSWNKGELKQDKVVQAARNIGINVEEFLEKKKGSISARKFGL